MTTVIINDDFCWMCGKKFSRNDITTTHHTLPKNLHPVNNILVPIHESCHNKINSVDFNSLVSFVNKLTKENEKMGSKIDVLNNLLTNFRLIEIKEKLNK